MNTENYSRRRFVRHGLTLAGVTFTWYAFRSNSLAAPAKAGQPASPDEALAELLAGNNECGAVKAAVDVVTKNAQLPGHLPELIAHLKASVEKAQGEAGSLVDNATRENVLLNVGALRNSEPVLADLVKQNRLRVVGGLYDLATGRVEVLS